MDYAIKVVEGFKEQISHTIRIDEINKTYRQARIWTFFEFKYAGRLTNDERKTVNRMLKYARWERIAQLGFDVPNYDLEANYDKCSDNI